MSRYDGFREFMGAYGGQLSRFAYLLTGNHHAAEDLLQTSLTKVAARWPRISGYDQPVSYVRRIMVHDHISGWRWRRRRPENPVPDVPEGSVPDAAESTVRRIVVVRALGQLSPRQRAVVVLRFYQDMTETQVAAELGVSVGTVKSQTHHALAKLRAVAPELADLLHNGSEVQA
ncbi:SigE family RNA polymerase sigma factor [Actinocatenispora rupis]|uniref:DNA-directed RNA polymerase sigma-70 factor n=1 Tax=Actinocatenispora rupis TaxID=519421 RepID=A0A8J3N8S0_9ACTN|nr:SigE family RNA polymerase sigma factor [Actinocatenispora rupis]GID10386.1 DNA-directed RNA polymerase sigma-70 factor [Actinocatenispora rupis]